MTEAPQLRGRRAATQSWDPTGKQRCNDGLRPHDAVVAQRPGDLLDPALGIRRRGAGLVAGQLFPLKKVFGKGAYVMQSMRKLIRYRFPLIRMRSDGAKTEAASVIISKGRLYGGHFRLAADAEPGDPGFSVVLFDRTGMAATMMYGAALPLNLLPHAPGVRHIRARRIDFLQNAAVPAQTDGERAGPAPLSVSDAPGPFQVVIG